MVKIDWRKIAIVKKNPVGTLGSPLKIIGALSSMGKRFGRIQIPIDREIQS